MMCLDDSSWMRFFICSQFVKIGYHGQNSDVTKKVWIINLMWLPLWHWQVNKCKVTSLRSSMLRKQPRFWLAEASGFCNECKHCHSPKFYSLKAYKPINDHFMAKKMRNMKSIRKMMENNSLKKLTQNAQGLCWCSTKMSWDELIESNWQSAPNVLLISARILVALQEF